MAQLQFDSVDRIAHATIVTAPDREECLARALDMAAALVCQSSGPVPCGVCRACRKAREGIHPDIIRVKRPEDDKGRPKREIPVDTVRSMAADAPFTIKMSGSLTMSTERTCPMTWTSFIKPLGKRGRKGLSQRREVKISFSEGLPSRLK